MKKLLLTAALLLLSVPSFAQNNTTGTSPDGTGADSVECKRNIAFFKTYARSENYRDAYSFWNKVYTNWPASTKDVYIIGAKVLNFLIKDTKDPKEQQKYFDQLMEMYDSRIKYYGDDPTYGVDYILGSKVSDYLSFLQAKADFDKAYNWLKPVVDEKGKNCDPLAQSLYLYCSMNRMRLNDKYKEQYVNDYLMITGFLSENIAAAQEEGNGDRAQFCQQLKEGADAGFASSGAASCDMLEKIYGTTIDDNKSNKEYLTKLLGLLYKVKCTDSPLYAKASQYMYDIEPSATAAIGLAQQALVKKNYSQAIHFYQEAVNLSETAEQKADAYYTMAGIEYQQRNFSRAREYCNQAMSVRPGYGQPMILIAQMYAASVQSLYTDDPILQRVVYCLVVDKAQRAKSIDPSVADEANQMIATYSKYYPKKEDVFMHPKLTVGASFKVGGWIGETTTIRTRD